MTTNQIANKTQCISDKKSVLQENISLWLMGIVNLFTQLSGTLQLASAIHCRNVNQTLDGAKMNAI